jgi:NADH-quinone oxidoreductase E subunit
MAWIAEDRRAATAKSSDQPLLTDAMKKHLAAKYFPRYPTRRAVVLPALHYIQHTYNYLPVQALEELAAFLEVAPSEILDTASFYEEYWLKPKGKYLVSVCRSLSCEICGSKELKAHLKHKLGIDPGQTTGDGRFTLVEVECLGSCGTAPVVMINDVLHQNLMVDQLDQVLASLPEDPHDYQDPTVNWNDEEH